MDLQRYLRSPFDNREDVWDFIREFASQWASPLSVEDGWSRNMLLEAEQRHHLALPAAMHEAYSLLGKHADLTQNEDVLLSPQQLRIAYQEALVFRDENQEASCLTIVMWEAMYDPQAHTDYADGGDEDDDLERLTKHYPELDAIALTSFNELRWFASPEALILTDGFGVHVRVRNEGELELVRERLPTLSENWLGGL